MAIRDRQPTTVIHHSDQGCQYTATAFGHRCRAAGVRPSMGSVGDAYDNAMCESFFATLECELLDRHRFETPAEARLAIFDFVEGFYNTHWRHSRLGYRSPLVFERTARAVEAAGAVDAENASTSSLENAENAFPTASTATTFSTDLVT
jgi:putative transposase